MAKFEVTYSDGTKKVEEQSDCETVEQFVNCRFGSNPAAQDAKVKLVTPAPTKK